MAAIPSSARSPGATSALAAAVASGTNPTSGMVQVICGTFVMRTSPTATWS